MTTFRKKTVLTQPPGIEGASKDKSITCVLLYVSFALIWYATWPFSERKLFWPFNHTQGSRVRVRPKILLACCLIFQPFNLICNMTIFWKSWFLTNSEVKSNVKVAQNGTWHSTISRCIHTHQIWDSYLNQYWRDAQDMIITGMRSRLQWPQNGTRHSVIPRCNNTPHLGFVPQIMLKKCSGHYYSRNEVMGQGNSDPKTVGLF